MSPASRLKDDLRRGPEQHVFWAERAAALYHTIGERAEQINRSSYGDFFGTVQMLLADRSILAITKMYERPGRYPLRSIPAVLAFLSEHIDAIPLVDRIAATRSAQRLALPLDPRSLQAPDSEFANALISAVLKACPAPDGTCALSAALSALKTRRDKAIAHHEHMAFAALPRVTWEDATLLLAFAKEVLNLVGAGFLDLVYIDADGRWTLALDTSKASMCASRILDALSLQPSAARGDRTSRSRMPDVPGGSTLATNIDE